MRRTFIGLAVALTVVTSFRSLPPGGVAAADSVRGPGSSVAQTETSLPASGPSAEEAERNRRLQAAQVALYQDPRAVEPHLIMGECYLDVGNLVAARHHLSAFLDRAPAGDDSTRGAYLHARTLFELGMTLRATRQFSQFIERPGLPAGAYHDYSALMRDDRFPAEAVMAESRAIETSSDPTFLREGARQWKELARPDQAIAYLQQLTESHPESAEAEDFFQIGYLAHTCRYKELAAGAYRRALEMDPTHAEAHFNASLIDESIGEIERAIFHLEQVLRLRPKYDRAYFQLGSLFLDHDRSVEAIDVFRRYLVHGQDSLALAEAKTLLDDLEAELANPTSR